MPKLFRMNLVIAALEYLHTQKGPLSFNLWNVYNGRSFCYGRTSILCIAASAMERL